MKVNVDYDHAKVFSNTEHPGVIYRCDFKDSDRKHWFYIGKTSQIPPIKRIKQHFNGDQFFDQRLYPYRESAEWMIVEKNIPISQLDAREQYYIETTKAQYYLNKGGLNFQWGGYKKSKINGPIVLCPFCGNVLKQASSLHGSGYRYVCEYPNCPNLFNTAEFHNERILIKFTKDLHKLKNSEEYKKLLDMYIHRDYKTLEILVNKLTEPYRVEDKRLYDKETKQNANEYLDKLVNAKVYDDSKDRSYYIVKKKVGQ